MKPSRTHLAVIGAARPNFMKIAPLYHALKDDGLVAATIVHTGQHYDLNMSDAFFRDLGLPEPDIHLGIGSGTHAEQTGKVMAACEGLFTHDRPDLVVVVGDVNSTMAATLAAAKLGIPVGHVEAGLRSFDRSMPEEINRIVTDTLAELLWTPSSDADENLKNEGIDQNRIIRVGNIMIDSLELLRTSIEERGAYRDYSLTPRSYGVVTLHRPSNVDSPEAMETLCAELRRAAAMIPLIFPVHPRTRKNLQSFGLLAGLASVRGLHIVDPLSYIPFMSLVWNGRAIITDSGGIQEETTYLGIPCITLRTTTERPITITQGTNTLCRAHELTEKLSHALNTPISDRRIPDLWDGNTAQRILASVKDHFNL